MALDQLTSAELLRSAQAAVANETKAITNVVRHFRAIFDRKLHLEVDTRRFS